MSGPRGLVEEHLVCACRHTLNHQHHHHHHHQSHQKTL